ncbi:MAG: hypothetical protein ACKPJN_20940, partial [Microcystis panniformis]
LPHRHRGGKIPAKNKEKWYDSSKPKTLYLTTMGIAIYQFMYYQKNNARFLNVPILFSQHEHRILTGQKPYFKGSSVCVMQLTGVIRDGTLIEKGI